MSKNYLVMPAERYAKLWRSLESIESKGNAGRARVRRVERYILKWYAGVEACGGRCVVPFPFAE